MELLKIKNFEFIGDSLSAVNINFDILDSSLSKLNINTEKFLMPYSNFFKDNKKRLDFIEDVFYDKKPNWDFMVSFVSANSSKLIKPIVFIDPNIYKYPESNLKSTVDYVVEKFRIIHPLFTDSTSTKPNYIENQKAIVYYYVNHIQNKIKINDTVNSDFANCVSQGTKTAILNCQNQTTSQKTYCNGKELTCLGCAGTPCQQEVSVTCVYPETKTSTTNRYIQAIIKSNFDDISEKEIKTIFLKIKNCDWVIERIL
jgi:hypothetical protein